MSDSYERSYYEIALTNSQVLSALAVLLLCLLGAFVGGMWVARGTAVAAPAGEVSEEPAAEAESEAEAAGEIDFFGQSPRESTDRSQQAERPRQTVTPVQVAADEPPAQRSEPVQTLRQPAPRPAPERRAAPTRPSPEPAQPATAAAASAGEDQQLASLFVIQVLSSNDQGQAAKTMARLQESGYRAFISPTEVEGRRMYRVRVGPYADREQAESAEEKIKRQFRLDTWITSSA